MIIERLDLIAFGHITNRSLDLSAGPNRFHLVVGPNESGKSTSLRAISSWLFGMATRADDAFLHPAAKLRVGGRLTTLSSDGSAPERVLECIRRRGRKNTLRGADDQAEIAESELAQMLGGVDEATFRSRFGLSHEELLLGGEQILRGEGELGEILFSAGAGIGRLREIYEQLDSEASERFKRTGKTPTINHSLQQLDEMRRRLREAQVPPAEFADLQKQLAEKEAQIQSWQEESQSLVQQMGRLQSTEQALPLIPRWKAATQELASVQDAPMLSDDFSDRRREWEQEQKSTTRLLQNLQQNHAELTQQRKQLGHDESIGLFESEILALYRDLPSREKAEGEKETLQQALASLEQEMRSQLHDLAFGESPLPAVHATTDDNQDALTQQVDSLQISESQRSKIQRLAGEYEKLVQQCDDASDQLDKAKRELTMAEDVLAESNVPTQFQLLDRTLEEMGAPERWIESARREQTQVDKLARECQTIHRRLKLETSSDDAAIQSAVELSPPTQSQLTEQTQALERAGKEVMLGQQRAKELQQSLANAEEKLASLKADAGDLPTPEDLRDARQHRDEILAGMKQNADSFSPDQWSANLAAAELAIHRADSISDIFQSQHESIYRRQAAQNNLDQLRRQSTEHDLAIADAQASLTQAQENWQSIWHAAGIPASDPDAMRTWMSDHQKLIEQFAELQTAIGERDQSHAQLRQAIARLQQALEIPESDTSSEDSLEPTCTTLSRLHDLALTQRAEQAQQLKLREQREHKRNDCRTEIPGLESNLQRRQTALDDWNQQWDELTASLNLSSKPAPQDALSMMDSITQLIGQKKQRDDISLRIAAIRQESETFVRRAIRLRDSLTAQDVDSTSPTDSAGDAVGLTELAETINLAHERLQREQRARSARDEVQQQLRQREQELADANEQLERLTITQQQLCDEAHCTAPEELGEVEARSRRRVIAESKVADLQAQLDHWASGQDRESFVESLRDQQPAMIAEELKQLTEKKRELDERLSVSQKELWSLTEKLKAIDGSGEASKLSQQMQFSLGKLQRESEEYIRLRLAAAILQRAMEHYRNQNQEPVLREAESFFATLTCDEYQALRVDYGDSDKPSLFGVRDGIDVPANRMSTGTADALYLALRLASLKHQLAHANAIPLIIDDCLIQLDDRRAAAALKVFSELSTTTQVILFTHHDHLVDLASETLPVDGYHVHRLGETSPHASTPPVKQSESAPKPKKKPTRKKTAPQPTPKKSDESLSPPDTLFDVFSQ
ncbi:DNA double-strand break repair Rad50 ATPase [Rhodopirellula islandica]|uniref:DNA double-strand break repair Rad50 ATPase n=1 Tax=Rhodopirellula islandica TaxID=595434 RepID=A0A0J1B883_RHOIS|nr:YhaN family protein [Rhodopirellula islandica]KLU02666.1 DNA double-strand break repair Rad50 ATPase [Rhodopirellula islandica]